MKSKSIKWGILGCGNVTEKKSGPAFYKVSNSQLYAVMRRNTNLAKDYAERHGVPKYYDDASDLIKDPEIDAVYIATPPAYHKSQAIACLKAGKPVYVEKPMGRNYQECLEMIETMQTTSTPLYVAYYRRALPKFLKIKEVIDNGSIGEVRSFATILVKPAPAVGQELPWRINPEISGGGLFVDLACHLIDVLDFCFGPVQRVTSQVTNQAKISEAEDSVSATFQFANGVIGTGNWCFNTQNYLDTNTIFGSKGRLTFANHGTAPLILENNNKREELTYTQPGHIEQPFIEQVVKGLQREIDFPSNAESAARINWVMDEILKDYYQS